MMNSAPPSYLGEQTFIVFAVEQELLAIPAELVLKITAPTPASAADGVINDGTRILMLDGSDYGEPAQLQVQGALHIVTVQASQVVALPPLCMTGNGIAAAIAIADERILFLIINPFNFLQSQSAPNRQTSPMESL